MDGWMHAWANKNDQLFELGTSDPRAPVRRSKKAKRHDNTLAEMSLHTPRSQGNLIRLECLWSSTLGTCTSPDPPTINFTEPPDCPLADFLQASLPMAAVPETSLPLHTPYVRPRRPEDLAVLHPFVGSRVVLLRCAQPPLKGRFDLVAPLRIMRIEVPPLAFLLVHPFRGVARAHGSAKPCRGCNDRENRCSRGRRSRSFIESN